MVYNGVSKGGFQLVMGVPQKRWMVFVRENPIKKWMMTGALFLLQGLNLAAHHLIKSSPNSPLRPQEVSCTFIGYNLGLENWVMSPISYPFIGENETAIIKRCFWGFFPHQTNPIVRANLMPIFLGHTPILLGFLSENGFLAASRWTEGFALPLITIGNWWCRWYTSHRPKPWFWPKGHYSGPAAIPFWTGGSCLFPVSRCFGLLWWHLLAGRDYCPLAKV